LDNTSGLLTEYKEIVNFWLIIGNIGKGWIFFFSTPKVWQNIL